MGAKVIITGRDITRLQETFSELEGDSNLQISAELTDEEQIIKLVDAIPSLDGFVNNAGIAIDKEIIKCKIMKLQKKI